MKSLHGFCPPRACQHRSDRFLTSLVVLGFASLCFAARTEARKAGTITYQNLASGGIAVGGVTSRVKDSTSKPRSRGSMAETFEVFLRSRADFPVMGADRVRSVVGADTHESMLDQFEWRGEVSPSMLDSLRAALVDSVRYLVVARIEKDEEDRDRDTIERDTDFDGKTDDSETFNTATRTVAVRFQVYDLREGKLAWNVRQTDSETAKAEVPKTPTIFKPYTVLGQLETLSGDKGPVPDMPDASWNLQRIFDIFTNALPKRKK